jgi:hypothetical protein
MIAALLGKGPQTPIDFFILSLDLLYLSP